MPAVLHLDFDQFGAALEGSPAAWDDFAEALADGRSSVNTVLLRSVGSKQVSTRREDDNLVIEAAPEHLPLLAAMARGLAEACRLAGPNPAVVRHGEIEPEPYLSWVAVGALPVHLVCLPPEG